MTPIQQIKHAIKAFNLPLMSGDYGTTVQDGHFVLDGATPVAICPIGALLLYYQPTYKGLAFKGLDDRIIAADLLGVSEDWVIGFIRGFDDKPLGDDLIEVSEGKKGFQVGCKFREEYWDKRW